jgi:hypothetical protein
MITVHAANVIDRPAKRAHEPSSGRGKTSIFRWLRFRHGRQERESGTSVEEGKHART